MKKVFISGLIVISNMAFSQTAQEKELQKAINQAGEVCHKLTQIFLSAKVEGSLMFSVACSGGQTYMVKAYPNGNAKVIDCKVMKQIGIQCFTKL